MLVSTKHKIVAALDARLIADWRKAHLLWSNQIAALWAVFSVGWLMMPALQAIIAPNVYVGLAAVMSVVFVWARLTHQKGLVNG
jgi:hypothetical protein